ncbi:hypothetical protein N8T08_007703 [Aspergillus melleus]|uniref:Uncharacterized protein n=1 Tax=Aspergillus melleus TaxID=138277 RepID=A0ACC3BF26_9EURO|nr:hypothetical protein N8T08_007703 [Aspergillus melleus]
MGECLHSVFSNRQSVFPQAVSLSSSFDLDLVKRVGRALGTEARAIGIHANFSPVLEISKKPRYGRSKGGLLSNAWSGRGRRELLTEVLPPFKAEIEQGKGGLEEQVTDHLTAKSPIDAIRQWLNIGGGIFLYDFTQDIIAGSIAELAKNGGVELATRQKRVRKVLEVKYDLGLFHSPYMIKDILTPMPSVVKGYHSFDINQARLIPQRHKEQGSIQRLLTFREVIEQRQRIVPMATVHVGKPLSQVLIPLGVS